MTSILTILLNEGYKGSDLMADFDSIKASLVAISQSDEDLKLQIQTVSQDLDTVNGQLTQLDMALVALQALVISLKSAGGVMTQAQVDELGTLTDTLKGTASDLDSSLTAATTSLGISVSSLGGEVSKAGGIS